MKANEFVKKYGWEKVKRCKKPSSRDNFFIVGGEVIRDQDLIDLKRLVESYQLIQSYKGCGKPREHALSTAKFTLNHFKSTRELEIKIYGNNDREVRLEQAILDVESCQ